jgi:PST family polysaccharide transporter
MKNGIAKNTASLYAMNIVKIVLPLITLPYLTRVLSKDCYGTVSYVKAVMLYMQIVVDFGFILSATKDIVNVRDNKDEVNKVIGDTLLAKFILLIISFIILGILMIAIPMLRANATYTILSFVVVGMTCFLMDFLFRGIEQMHIITVRYVIMRGIATALTFVFVKNDSDIIWIPILDMIGSLVAIILVFVEMKKRDYHVRISGYKSAVIKLKESALFFISSMATTAFTALNTLLIGIFINVRDVANWSLCMQIVSAVQAFYTPITDGIYPYMVKNKDLNLVKRTAKIFMTLITFGCIFTFVIAKYAILIIGGDKYIDATPLLRAFIPLLFFSFPAILVGWPTLGAIGKVNETTKTTLITAGLQVLGIVLLLATGQFTVINLAILRGVTEACMFAMRFGYCKKFRGEFAT